MKLDPSEFRDVLLAIGFSYFEDLKIPQRGESFQRTIMMCCKSAGDTPYNIRNGFREAARLHMLPSPPVDAADSPLRPPPVRYNPYNTPNSPMYSPLGALDSSPDILSVGVDVHQEELITSTVLSTNPDINPGEATPLVSRGNEAELNYDVGISGPDSTSQH